MLATSPRNSNQTRNFGFEKLDDVFPSKRDQHVGHGLLFGILEISEGFEQMNPVVCDRCIFDFEPLKNVLQSPETSRHIQVDKITAAAAIGNSVEFHACDIARVGDRDHIELAQRKNKRVWIMQKADFYATQFQM